MQQFGEKARSIQSGPMLPLVKVASESVGISKHTISGFLNLKASPRNEKGERMPSAQMLADALAYDFEELFPSHLYSGKFCSAAAEVPAIKLVGLRAAGEIQDRASSVEEKLVKADRSEAINCALYTLTPTQEKVIKMRFGLGYDREYTLAEVGDAIGRTRSEAARIEAQALRRLRHPDRSTALAPFIYDHE